MGLGHYEPGIQWAWDTMGLTQWDWDTMGLAFNRTQTQQD